MRLSPLVDRVGPNRWERFAWGLQLTDEEMRNIVDALRESGRTDMATWLAEHTENINS